MKEIIEKICCRVYTNGLRFHGRLPRCSTDVYGKYELTQGGGWTDSFYLGMVYVAYAYTKDKKYLRIADQYQAYFRRRAENDLAWCRENNVMSLDHDTGFIFSLSQVLRFRLTGDREARTMAIQAADILARRFHTRGNFIRAWDEWPGDSPRFREEKKGKMIVDSMMNLDLLFWAAKETGNAGYAEIAARHADTVASHILRQDGSTFHQFNFDPETGAPLKGVTGQGYADESCWSRGQAWAIYGFTQTYRNTGEQKYLDAALKTADYFIRHLTPAGLPLWDFACDKQVFRPIDASAAAIALSGLASVHSFCPDSQIEAGTQKLLNGLLTHCSALEIPGWESVLLHACVGPAYQKGEESRVLVPYLDCPIIYADYYFLEALMKIEGAWTP